MNAIQTHNGWPNYPTWNVALWMDNDEGSYGYARELTRTAINENTEVEYVAATDPEGEDAETSTLDRDGAVMDLADALEAWHEEATPEPSGFAADIFGWAMQYVDWRHIAGHLVDDAEGS